MSTALYRRYRPDTFQEVIGQDHVTGPLMNALEKNRVNHAYLFSGPRGCGKTTSARILARCLNCAQGPTPTPCGECESCVALATGGPGSLDVIEIDAASHGGVDDARDLRERATFAPTRDRFKIFIIDEAHMVTAAGFNALLKIVEEPPPHIKFIFATTEPDKVIGTIRSRTHHYPFRLVPPEPLMNYLETLTSREQVPVAPGVLSLVVRAGGGSVRDTLSVLDQLMAGATADGVSYELAVNLLGFTPENLLDDVVDALAANDSATVFRVVDRVVQSGQDPRRFVEDLLERFRDVIVVKAMPEEASAVLHGTPEDQLRRLRTQADQLGAAEVSRAADVTAEALTSMQGATSPRLHLELLVARLMLPTTDETQRGLAARLERIERRLDYGGVEFAGTGEDAGAGAAGTGGKSSADAGFSGGLGSSSPASAAAGSAGAGSDSGLTGAERARAAMRAKRAPEQAKPAEPVEQPSQPPAPSGQESAQPSDAPSTSAAPSSPATPPWGAPPTEAPQSAPSTSPSDSGPTAHPEQPQRPEQSEQPRQAEQPQQPQQPQPVAQPEQRQQPEQPQQSEQPAPVQEPTAEAPQQAAPASAESRVSQLEMVRRAWPEVIDYLQQHSRLIWMLAKDNAQIAGFDGSQLAVGIANDGARQTMLNRGGKELLAEAFHNILGISPTIDLIVGHPNQGPAGDSSQSGMQRGEAGPKASGRPKAAGSPRQDRPATAQPQQPAQPQQWEKPQQPVPAPRPPAQPQQQEQTSKPAERVEPVQPVEPTPQPQQQTQQQSQPSQPAEPVQQSEPTQPVQSTQQTPPTPQNTGPEEAAAGWGVPMQNADSYDWGTPPDFPPFEEDEESDRPDADFGHDAQAPSEQPAEPAPQAEQSWSASTKSPAAQQPQGWGEAPNTNWGQPAKETAQTPPPAPEPQPVRPEDEPVADDGFAGFIPRPDPNDTPAVPAFAKSEAELRAEYERRFGDLIPGNKPNVAEKARQRAQSSAPQRAQQQSSDGEQPGQAGPASPSAPTDAPGAAAPNLPGRERSRFQQMMDQYEGKAGPLDSTQSSSGQTASPAQSSNQAQQYGQQGAPGSAARPAPKQPVSWEDEVASDDDIRIEDSGLAGREVVERLLNARLIEERNPDGTPKI